MTTALFNTAGVNYNQRFRARARERRRAGRGRGRLIYEGETSELIYKMVDPYRRGRAMAVTSSVNNDVLADIPRLDCVIN